MPLPKLARLEQDLEKPPRLPNAGRIQTAVEVDPFAPTGLSGSREEEWIKQYLAKRRGYWRQQVGYGIPNERGSTVADFQSDYYKAVIFADGAYFHDPKKAKDALKESLVRQFGFTVYRFRYPSFDYLTKNFPSWYNQRFAS